MEPDTHIMFPSIGSVAEAEINKIKEADLKKIKGDKFTHLQWDLLTMVLFKHFFNALYGENS
ncbi:hypothetical protein [Paenibacillus polymyxa]|uniref:hypothetical protein n=1 Tax=Paenibacillus polymyxa TaxID=1406 RepID=UPI0004DEEFB1|nr:hypothetical protein [Paenibacillus polymyxa]